MVSLGKIRVTNNWEMKLTFQFLFVGSASNNLVNATKSFKL